MNPPPTSLPITSTCILSCKNWIANLCLTQDTACLGLVHGDDPERCYRRIYSCTSQSWQSAFHWENSAQPHWVLKLHLCFAFVPNIATIIGKNCQNAFILITKRKLFLKMVAFSTAPTSYIFRWKRQVELCFFLINKLALMEVINANCLAREADFSFLVGIP